ncbi:MAG: helix-turn-helix domain-containing protein [Betaproteobacteria bacterium]|nr:helix-turn-helix domain-containing protein [Betaproteobacteria bacterium]
MEILDIGQIFGEILRHHRSEKNISQEELAYRAGVDRTFVSRLERGIRQPTITTLIGLGRALGVPAADLVRETEKEYLRQGDFGSSRYILDSRPRE